MWGGRSWPRSSGEAVFQDFSSAARLTTIGAQGHDDDRRKRMSEESMERSVQDALAHEGIADEVVAAGQFSPRGHSGSLVLGGMAGDSLGGVAGAAGAAVGTVAGMAGATEATDAARGLPDHMV